jgi:hypothetical protein
MIPNELTEKLRANINSLKEVQDRFLETYKQVCAHYGGAEWRKKEAELISHQARMAIVPLLEQAGMDQKGIQALCSWAERHARS